jgi:DNA-binding response OmpR family regulator
MEDSPVFKKTYYDLRLTLTSETLHPLTVRALGRIISAHGDTLSFDALVDDMFGVAASMRASVVKNKISLLRSELDEVCDLNASLLRAGPSGPVETHGYRLTQRAVAKIDRKKT